MSEGLDGGVGIGEGEGTLHDDADTGYSIPNTHELDLDILRIRLLESGAQFDAFFILSLVELVGERNLSLVSSRQKPSLVQETCEGAGEM